MTGVVIGGDKIGRTMDFPTANVDLKRIKPGLYMVFFLLSMLLVSMTMAMSYQMV